MANINVEEEYKKKLKKCNMVSSVEMITPEKAKKFLEIGNPNNRAINKPTVKMYARSMMNGKWEITHQGIAFSDGMKEMLDGHHRCHAVILANVAVPMYVTYNVPNSEFIDGGRVRSPRERLAMAGYGTFSNSLIGAANMWVCLSEGLSFVTAKIDADEKYNWIIKHFAELDDLDCFAHSNNRMSNRAPIICAKLSALQNGVPAEIINKWSEIIDTGNHEGGAGNTAAKFREAANINKFFNRGEAFDTLKRAQRNIEAYYHGDILTKIYTPSKLLWDIVEPINEEEN